MLFVHTPMMSLHAVLVCKKHSNTLSRKNKWKVRESGVRNNQFCQCIAVWSNFLSIKITHHIKVKFPPSYKK